LIREFENWFAIRLRANPKGFSEAFEERLKNFFTTLFEYDPKMCLTSQGFLEKLCHSEAEDVREHSSYLIQHSFRAFFQDIGVELAEDLALSMDPVG